MALKLYSYPNNPRAWKAQIAAEYSNGAVKIETPPFQIGTDNKGKDFLAKFPVGKVPALETPEGTIFESNAIARHVARLAVAANPHAKLFGSSQLENAHVDQWIDFASSEIELPTAAWLFPILQIVPFHKEATEKAKGDIKKAMTILNTHLNTRTFLVGERISLADISVAMTLYRLYQLVMDPGFRKPFGNVTRWYLTVVNQSEVRKVVGEVTLSEKMQVAVETAPAPAKAEEKKKEEKPAGGDHGEGEEGGEKKKKGPNPLDLLPESKLVMDEWKRTYSNTKKIKEEAMPWFWEHLDQEGYSLWYCDYKYNSELDVLFRVSNLVSGFVQRLDPLRKYGFGSMLIFGDEEGSPKKYEVAGVWLVRGKELPLEMTECEDSAHYNFKKLDPNNPADRKIVEDFWAREGDFSGHLKFLDSGRVFK